MIEIIPVLKPINASIKVPGSKSITNRALLIAALAKGESILTNCLISDDTKYMLAALKQLGISINETENKIIIQGRAGIIDPSSKDIFLGNAGTAVRFLTAACSLGNPPYRITGNQHMQKRPISPLLKALDQAGISSKSNGGCPPHLIESGTFKGGIINIEGSLSSQYISALLMIAPYAQNSTQINIVGDLSSKPYVDITLAVMEKFDIKVINNNYQSFSIESEQKYNAKHYQIESDFSSASYFAAIAALTNSKIKLENLSFNSAQGDKDFLKVIERMGCKVSTEENNIIVQGTEKLTGLGEVDLNHIPDTALTVAILAAKAEGETKITNVANLRIKETDRLAALENELKKIGVKVSTDKSSITITGNPKGLNGAEIKTYDDHRIAMCFACLGTVIPGLKIQTPDCVQKSYPNFWRDIKKIGIKLNSQK